MKARFTSVLTRASIERTRRTDICWRATSPSAASQHKQQQQQERGHGCVCERSARSKERGWLCGACWAGHVPTSSSIGCCLIHSFCIISSKVVIWTSAIAVRSWEQKQADRHVSAMAGKEGRIPCVISPHPEASREADLVQQLVLVAMQLQEPRRKECAPLMLGLVAVELADCTQPNTHTCRWR